MEDAAYVHSLCLMPHMRIALICTKQCMYTPYKKATHRHSRRPGGEAGEDE